MSQESDYSNRIIKDIEHIIDDHNQFFLKRNSDYIFHLIYNNIRLRCIKEIVEISKSDENLAKYIEKLSNEILMIITNLKESEEKEEHKVSSNLVLLESIKEMASNNNLESQKEIASAKRKRIVADENKRKIGTRPEKLSEKRRKRSEVEKKIK